MPNPNNMVSLSGTINGEIKFISANNVEFAMKFNLDVPRNYRNKNGIYETDSIPVRYEFGDSDALKSFVHSIEVGDQIRLSGTMKTVVYQGNTSVFCLAESISLDEKVRKEKFEEKKVNKKRNEKGDELISMEFYIDLPLPV